MRSQRDNPVLNACFAPNCDAGQEAQEQTLRQLLRLHESSVAGRTLGLRDIESLEDFQRNVPLVGGESARQAAVKLRTEFALSGESMSHLRRSSFFRNASGSLGQPVPEGAWLDLGDCVQRATRATRSGRAITFSDAMDGALSDLIDHSVNVVVGPMHWLAGILCRLRHIGRPPHERARAAAEEPWPSLNLVIGTSVGPSAHRVLVEAELVQSHRCVPLIAAYQTPDGTLAGIETEPGLGAYTLLPDAGVFFEFLAGDSREESLRVPLWKVKCGVEYELCISTAMGLFGYRTGQLVRFLAVQKHRPAQASLIRNAPVNGVQTSVRVASRLEPLPTLTTWSRISAIQC